MSRLQLFWFVYLTLVSNSHGSIKQFLQKDNSPKCCKDNEIISEKSTPDEQLIYYKCVPNFNKNSYVITNESLPTFNNSDAASCIDELLLKDENSETKTIKFYPENMEYENLKPVSFPKCCPINSAYDTLEHKCVALITNDTDEDFLSFTDEFLKEHLSEGFFFIKPGLTKCDTVIADYELEYFDETIFKENKAIFLDILDKTYPYGSYCVDKVYNSDNYVARICHDNFDICRKNKNQNQKTRCIRKCCPDGKIYRGGGKCKYDFEHGLSFGNDTKIKNLDESFAIIPGIDCRKYMVQPHWDYTLDEMGLLKLNLEEDKSSHTPFDHTYCFEHVEFGIIEDKKLFLCFKGRDKERIEFQIIRIALLFSAIFLILTLLGYILLPEMQNLHGKTLMCHCVSLLVAFVFLAVLQFHPTISEYYCRLSGYIVMYLFLAAFMWSNIMCFDIWWTFGSMRVQGVNQRKKELKRFLFYCLYAWSVPLVITLATFCMQHFQESVPEFFQPIVPDLGTYNCFFEQRTNVVAFLTWFALPLLLIIICNFVLYIKTILYCYKVKNEIEKMKDSQSTKNERKKALSADSERMKMALKLFLVMGIPWMFETISLSFIPVPARGATQVVQIIFDCLNCLQGVFIFCIFILKVKFFHALQKKLGLMYVRRSSQSTSGTMSTYASKI